MRTDDMAAVEAAYHEHRVDLERYALFLTRDASVVQDIVHETFVSLLSKPRRIDNVGAFLRTSVRNRVFDRSRRADHRLQVVVAEPTVGADLRSSLAFDKVEFEEVWAATADLSDRQRDCAVLRYLFDLSPTEIAAELGCSRSAVNNHLERATARLAAALEDLR